ncbi:hypothetical protein MRX96_059446 [Rhipicephalus microplus]
MGFEVGARFSCFSDFDRAFREYQLQNNTLFVAKATKTVDVVNSRLSVGLERLQKKLKYANATYVCKHAGERRCTATGVRPQQRTMKQGCPATVVIAARWTSQQLEITKIDCNHNHEVNKEIFQLYPENRRLTHHEKEYVLALLDLNVLPNVIAGKLAEKTGKVVTTQDLHNVKRNCHGRDEAEQLLQEIEKCRQQHWAKIIPITDENEELQILFIQTPHMQQAYKSFPEVVLLDATYRTNKLKMPLFVFVVQDGCGESQVIAYAFVASEQCHHVTEMLNLFVKENPCSENTGVIVVDKDFTEISAIRSAFPSAPSIQLCQFHVMKAFRTAASHERDKMVTTFNEMLHAPNSSKFEDAQSEFTRFASKDSIEYLEKNWLSIKNMWVRHICDQEFTCGANTTNRVEAHNGFIKTALSSSTKLHDALHLLFQNGVALPALVGRVRQIRH